MATVGRRVWKSRGVGGRRVKKVAWGFSLVVGGKQEKSYREDWSKEDAEKALAARLLGLESASAAKAPAESGLTFGQACERWLAAKSRKRTVEQDRLQLEHLKSAFGADVPLSSITAARVSEYKGTRLAAKSERTGRRLAAASVNRPLALLRALMRMACEEWEVLPSVPRVRLEREPQGRLRFLSEDEEARLLSACAASQNKSLLPLVTVALETGLRRGELVDLTWDRVDFSRGVVRLEVTKSGKRREVPMRQAVHDALSSLPGAREGRVWPAGDFRKAWEAAVEAAKLDAPFRFHDCRHSFASWYMMRGGSLQALQQILGHATISMTLRYSHLSPAHLRGEMAKTERALPSGIAHGQRTAVEAAEAGRASG